MTRNPDATCANCPYWLHKADWTWAYGYCLRYAPKDSTGESPCMNPDAWCGEHPDFWLPERMGR